MFNSNYDSNDAFAKYHVDILEKKLKSGWQRVREQDTAKAPDYYSLDKNVKVQQAMLRRQELMDKIKREEYVDEDLMNRPRTYSPRHRPSPSPPPPSRFSLPELSKRNLYVSKHSRLSNDSPYFPPIHNNPNINKSDVIEMMMMQNAQIHQIFMQQMVASALKLPSNTETLPPPKYNKDDSGPVSIHHHHYGTPVPPMYPQAVNPLPPPYEPAVEEARPELMKNAPNRQYVIPPADVRNLPPVKKKLSIHVPAVIARKVRRRTSRYPFPGTKRVRKLRRLFHAVWFVKILQSLARKNDSKRNDHNTRKLASIINTLHGIYLNPSGPIEPILREFTLATSPDYGRLMAQRLSDVDRNTLKQLQYILEHLAYNITDIMPPNGALGTDAGTALSTVTQSTFKFPTGYFYEAEKMELSFNALGALLRVDDRSRAFLIVGLFFTRALITTLLLKPHQYRLVKGSLSRVVRGNLKLLASIMLYLVRRSIGSSTMEPFKELENDVFSDQEMAKLNGRLKKTYSYCVNLIREWSKEYVQRIRSAKD